MQTIGTGSPDVPAARVDLKARIWGQNCLKEGVYTGDCLACAPCIMELSKTSHRCTGCSHFYSDSGLDTYITCNGKAGHSTGYKFPFSISLSSSTTPLCCPPVSVCSLSSDFSESCCSGRCSESILGLESLWLESLRPGSGSSELSCFADRFAIAVEDKRNRRKQDCETPNQ
jgi:hypothetical protein